MQLVLWGWEVKMDGLWLTVIQCSGYVCVYVYRYAPVALSLGPQTTLFCLMFRTAIHSSKSWLYRQEFESWLSIRNGRFINTLSWGTAEVTNPNTGRKVCSSAIGLHMFLKCFLCVFAYLIGLCAHLFCRCKPSYCCKTNDITDIKQNSVNLISVIFHKVFIVPKNILNKIFKFDWESC
jgi:hypothetical protein